MRGDLTIFVLEAIQMAAGVADEAMNTLTYIGRTAHYKRLRHIAEKNPEGRLLFEKQIELLKDKRRFDKLISKLKGDGLIAKNTINHAPVITKAGETKLRQLKELNVRNYYEVKKSNELKIIIFDIPERESAHRLWLRQILKTLGFSMLQKSVWVGDSSLPEKFVENLRMRGIEKFVEILAVTKHGTLRQVNN